LKFPEKSIPAHWPTLTYRLSMTSMVWNISTGQPGYQSGYAPSHLLHTCSLAEYGRLEKVLESLATNTIGVINILLVINPKHINY